MAIAVQNMLSERKFPFLFALSFLLISITLLLLSNNSFPSFSLSDLQHSQSHQQPQPQSHSLPPPLPTPIHSAPAIEDILSSPQSKSEDNNVYIPSNQTSSNDATSADSDLDVSWKLCKGAVAVDYIPCLDNFKAIKELKSRRHMEHRERHCPKENPLCLVPLPNDYKVPVPWPKSRDMVRLFDTFFDLV
uniref:Methyltransferase n=1 Tax=Bixa orellana TaxID=66672 RepID=A0A9Y1EIJ4_BIXOR|nr:putative methyltransferase PMT23 [Bixa orellana]QTZ19643.1 putative methyltransferase PMT23 [Bixa orellana]